MQVLSGEEKLPQWCNSVLAIRPKIHGFKPGQSHCFLRAIKISSIPSFGGEVKLEDPCHNILQHVRNHLLSMNRNTSQGHISSFPSPISPACYDASRIARKLWWMNQFSSVNIILPWFSMFMYHLRDKQ
jgi:hypothetical protein